MDNIIYNFHTLNMLQNLRVIIDITFGFQHLFVCLFVALMVTWFALPYSSFVILQISRTFIQVYQHQYLFHFQQRYWTTCLKYGLVTLYPLELDK